MFVMSSLSTRANKMHTNQMMKEMADTYQKTANHRVPSTMDTWKERTQRCGPWNNPFRGLKHNKSMAFVTWSNTKRFGFFRLVGCLSDTVKSSRFSISMEFKFTDARLHATNWWTKFFIYLFTTIAQYILRREEEKNDSTQYKITTCFYVRVLQRHLEWVGTVNDAPYMFACWKHDIMTMPHK